MFLLTISDVAHQPDNEPLIFVIKPGSRISPEQRIDKGYSESREEGAPSRAAFPSDTQSASTAWMYRRLNGSIVGQNPANRHERVLMRHRRFETTLTLRGGSMSRLTGDLGLGTVSAIST
jgi:hypothetical protein